MQSTRIGILGGGQLGMLLIQSAIYFPVRISVYDPDPNCTAARFLNDYTQGSFDDYDKLVAFGEKCDVLIFEIEKINVKALKKLQEMGKKILSDPKDLEWIQDKSVQRAKLAEKGFPVPQFFEVDAKDVRNYQGTFPIVQKWKSGGYDGLGVSIHENADSLKNAAEVDSLFEEKINITMELSVIIARDKDGNTAVYEPVEMVFDPEANLVDYLIAPARISPELREEAKSLCQKIAQDFQFYGIYAVELFIDENNRILVNEIAPRPHNSGHHTVPANVTSQYEQQIRMALDLPLGSVDQISPCVLLNLLGANSTGETYYKGIEDAYKIPNVQYVFYGKSQVRQKRKMGHALILEKDIDTALERLAQIKSTLTITAHD